MSNLGASELVVILIGLAIGVGMLALYVWSLVWVYRDAEARGRSGILVALLVALFAWPFGLVIWLVARPR